MILGLLHDKASFIQGLMYLLYYNIIFVAPLIAILWFASQKFLYDKVKQWRNDKMSKLGIVDAFIMIILGMVILFI